MSAPMRLKCPRQERRCVSRKENAACRMAHSPIPRSNWQDSSSWNSLPLTQPSIGQRDAREHRSAQLKSGRWRLKPCGGGYRMNGSNQEDTHRTIERVARESYGRLVAYLSSHTRDVASAEDALSNALVAALTAWPRDGVPQNPEAWLLTTARHSFIDLVRHRQVAEASEPTLQLLREDSMEMTLSAEFPDERLKLLFVCAHPAIDPAMHTPLMLQTVLGLDAARIAHAFLVSPTTMGQRLVRAKTKIRDGGIQFEVPQERELPQRLDAVLEAIYAAFGIGWDDMAGVDQRGRDLAEEAIWLARVLLQLMPKEAEVRGLLALMLHCEARRRGAAWTGRPLYSSLGAGLAAVVSAIDRRGGTPSRRSVESRSRRPVSTRGRDSVGTR